MPTQRAFVVWMSWCKPASREDTSSSARIDVCLANESTSDVMEACEEGDEEDPVDRDDGDGDDDKDA